MTNSIMARDCPRKLYDRLREEYPAEFDDGAPYLESAWWVYKHVEFELFDNERDLIVTTPLRRYIFRATFSGLFEYHEGDRIATDTEELRAYRMRKIVDNSGVTNATLDYFHRIMGRKLFNEFIDPRIHAARSGIPT